MPHLEKQVGSKCTDQTKKELDIERIKSEYRREWINPGNPQPGRGAVCFSGTQNLSGKSSGGLRPEFVQQDCTNNIGFHSGLSAGSGKDG